MAEIGKHYTIGQLARATDTKAVTIRYYERLASASMTSGSCWD